MKIGMNVNKVISVYSNSAKTENEKRNHCPKGDRIELSTAGKEISKYVEMAKNTEIRNSRVAEIKELINQGKYKVDSEKLAQSILDHIKESEK